MAATFATRIKDMTTIEGNPAQKIHDDYKRLMQIENVDELVLEGLKIIAAGGLSEKNAAKFRFNIQRAAEKGLAEVQKFLTNWVMAAAGLRVLGVSGVGSR